MGRERGGGGILDEEGNEGSWCAANRRGVFIRVYRHLISTSIFLPPHTVSFESADLVSL